MEGKETVYAGDDSLSWSCAKANDSLNHVLFYN